MLKPRTMSNGRHPVTSGVVAWMESIDWKLAVEKEKALEIAVAFDPELGYSTIVNPDASNIMTLPGGIKSQFALYWFNAKQEDGEYHYMIDWARLDEVKPFSDQFSINNLFDD